MLFQVCYLNCIRLLLKHGANPNCSYRLTLTPLHVLLFTVSENFTLNCDVQKRANFEFIKNILLLLLQHGLNCNVTSQQPILKSIIEMIHNVRTYPDISYIYELLLILIQYGADPNVSLNGSKSGSSITNNSLGIPINLEDEISRCQPSSSNGLNERDSRNYNENFKPSFRNSRSYLLLYYITLITKKEFLLADPELNYIKIILLFYYSMQHESLHNCLKILHNLLIAQVPNKSTEHLITLISSLVKKPRTLKQITRLKIYDSLNKKLAPNINRLNLPALIKDYVLNFEN